MNWNQRLAATFLSLILFAIHIDCACNRLRQWTTWFYEFMRFVFWLRLLLCVQPLPMRDYADWADTLFAVAESLVSLECISECAVFWSSNEMDWLLLTCNRTKVFQWSLNAQIAVSTNLCAHRKKKTIHRGWSMLLHVAHHFFLFPSSWFAFVVFFLIMCRNRFGHESHTYAYSI